MKKTIIIDFIIILLTFYLTRIYFTSILFHQLLGILAIVLFTIHVLSYKNDVKTNVLNLKKKDISIKSKVYTIFKGLIILDVLIIAITGLLINTMIPLDFLGYTLFANLHFFCAYLAIILLAIYVALNFNKIVDAICEYLKIGHRSLVVSYIFLVICIGLSIYGIKTLFTKNTFIKTLTFKHEDITADNELEVEESYTMKDFLKNKNCTGCGKNCNLLYPECALGSDKRANAIDDFNEKYETDFSHGVDNLNFLEYVSVFTLIASATYYLIKIPAILNKDAEIVRINKK